MHLMSRVALRSSVGTWQKRTCGKGCACCSSRALASLLSPWTIRTGRSLKTQTDFSFRRIVPVGPLRPLLNTHTASFLSPGFKERSVMWAQRRGRSSTAYLNSDGYCSTIQATSKQ